MLRLVLMVYALRKFGATVTRSANVLALAGVIVNAGNAGAFDAVPGREKFGEMPFC